MTKGAVEKIDAGAVPERVSLDRRVFNAVFELLERMPAKVSRRALNLMEKDVRKDESGRMKDEVPASFAKASSFAKAPADRSSFASATADKSGDEAADGASSFALRASADKSADKSGDGEVGGPGDLMAVRVFERLVTEVESVYGLDRDAVFSGAGGQYARQLICSVMKARGFSAAVIGRLLGRSWQRVNGYEQNFQKGMTEVRKAEFERFVELAGTVALSVTTREPGT